MLLRATLLLILFVSSTAWAYIDEVLPSLETFSGYRPSYFVIGTPDTKIQISFKAQVVKAVPFYLGYSQVMSWDLFQNSSPIRDIDFNPDVFYRLSVGGPERPQSVDFGFFEHESNGKNGVDSRAWNRAYVRFNDTLMDPERKQPFLHWNLKASLPYLLEPNDYPEYRGILELNVTMSHFLGDLFERDDVSLRLYTGGKSFVNPALGGQEITLRLKSKDRSFLPLFVLQFFHGYASNMLDYNKVENGVRAGIGF